MNARLPALPSHPALRWFVPDEDLSDALVLSGELRESIDQLHRELTMVERFLANGIDPPTRVLFSGPSGTGKTLAARWLGWKLRLPLAVVDVAAMVGPHLGETSKSLTGALQVAAGLRSIVFLDEIDAVCSPRDSGGDGAADAEIRRATTTLLQQFDWLKPSQIVFAATNFPDNVDGALRRRLTTQIAFTAPERAARRKMLDAWLAKSSLEEAALDAIADTSEGMSGAELRAYAMAEARRALLALPPEKTPRAKNAKKLADEAFKEVCTALGGSP